MQVHYLCTVWKVSRKFQNMFSSYTKLNVQITQLSSILCPRLIYESRHKMYKERVWCLYLHKYLGGESSSRTSRMHQPFRIFKLKVVRFQWSRRDLMPCIHTMKTLNWHLLEYRDFRPVYRIDARSSSIGICAYKFVVKITLMITTGRWGQSVEHVTQRTCCGRGKQTYQQSSTVTVQN